MIIMKPYNAEGDEIDTLFMNKGPKGPPILVIDGFF